MLSAPVAMGGRALSDGLYAALTDNVRVAMTDLKSPIHGQLLGTVAGHASAKVPVARPDDTVDEVLTHLRGRVFDSAAVVAVCDGERLAGLVTIERLLAGPPRARIADVMDAQPPAVAPGTDQERAAWKAVRHGEPGLAVVDASGRFQGLIPPQRMLAVLLEEHDEDMARLGGFLRSTRAARTASIEPVARRLWHRLPWLLLGLLGALLAALIVGFFEAELEEEVLLAFFIPGVVYIADAVGTQTEALVIRGLSVGVSIVRVAVREAVTGALLGLLLAALAFPLVLLIWNHAEVALTVSVAIFGASAIATIVAMALPWTINRLGKDPAFGSGPLATVVQDLLSVFIYLMAATAITT
jgi:magnesium transporter